jgi:hypothetical protein
MKKIFLTFLAASTLFISCNNEEKKDKANTEEAFSIKKNSIILKWTAYKTTEKAPVGGEFTKVNVTDIPQANSPEKSLEGLNFSIPVSSIFTNNETRDNKLQSFFFGAMDNTEFLSGTFTAIEGDNKEGHGVINLKMNNIPCDLPFDYTIDKTVINIASTLNLKYWKAEPALDSLNKACLDLHKGADGISKTWEEVTINASVDFEVK